MMNFEDAVLLKDEGFVLKLYENIKNFPKQKLQPVSFLFYSFKRFRNHRKSFHVIRKFQPELKMQKLFMKYEEAKLNQYLLPTILTRIIKSKIIETIQERDNPRQNQSRRDHYISFSTRRTRNLLLVVDPQHKCKE